MDRGSLPSLSSLIAVFSSLNFWIFPLAVLGNKLESERKKTYLGTESRWTDSQPLPQTMPQRLTDKKITNQTAYQDDCSISPSPIPWFAVPWLRFCVFPPLLHDAAQRQGAPRKQRRLHRIVHLGHRQRILLIPLGGIGGNSRSPGDGYSRRPGWWGLWFDRLSRCSRLGTWRLRRLSMCCPRVSY